MTLTTNYSFDKSKRGHQDVDDDIGRIADNLDLIDREIKNRDSGSGATFTVAASDSAHKERADFVCDGVDDQVGIQAAIDACLASEYAGTIHLMAGFYSISAPIIWKEKYGITIEGEWGRKSDICPTPTEDHIYSGGTTLGLADDANCSMFVLPETTKHLKYLQVKNIILVGNRDQQDPGATSHCFDMQGSFSDSIFKQVVIMCFLGDAWHLEPGANADRQLWHIQISDAWIEHNRYGFYYNGNPVGARLSQSILSNLQFMCNERDIYTDLGGSEHGSIRVIGCQIFSGVTMINTPGMIFVGNIIRNLNDGEPVIKQVGLGRSLFTGNMIRMAEGQLLLHGPTATQSVFASNHIFQSGVGAAQPIVAPLSVLVRNNIGYFTESCGTATLASGTTSKEVTHHLSLTPKAGDIFVTPIEAWGNMTQFYIDTYTATQFTIRANIDPGQDVEFAWKAIVL